MRRVDPESLLQIERCADLTDNPAELPRLRVRPESLNDLGRHRDHFPEAVHVELSLQLSSQVVLIERLPGKQLDPDEETVPVDLNRLPLPDLPGVVERVLEDA